MTLKRFCILAVLAALLLLPVSNLAYAAARDMTNGLPPQARAGMVRGLLVLGIPAVLVFVGILTLALKMKPRERSLREEAASPDHSAQASIPEGPPPAK
ncbi:MAG: hypothetical protein WAM66_03065 [Acidobacteriaceae bacterium]